MSGCRIGKVKLKGGAELHRLPTAERDDLQRRLIDHASMISGYYKPGDLHGFVVMAWAADGTHSLGFRCSRDGFVGATLLPAFVADALRRRMIEEGDWSK